MFNLNGPSTVFILDNAGNFHRMDTTIRPLGPRSDILLMAAGSEGVIVPGVAKVGEIPVHLLAAKAPAVACVLPFLHIRTFYMASGTGKDLCMIPWFQAENAIDFTCDWTPPADCKVVFVWCRSIGHCFMVAIHTDAKGGKLIRRIPLPNIYGDGRICMGNAGSGGWVPNAAHSLVEGLNSAITHFSTSVWNSDMLETSNRDRLSTIMRFNVDGKQLKPTGTWHEFCPIISGVPYNWVVNMPLDVTPPIREEL